MGADNHITVRMEPEYVYIRKFGENVNVTTSKNKADCWERAGYQVTRIESGVSIGTALARAEDTAGL